jgi:hypothetical protein
MSRQAAPLAARRHSLQYNGSASDPQHRRCSVRDAVRRPHVHCRPGASLGPPRTTSRTRSTPSSPPTPPSSSPRTPRLSSKFSSVPPSPLEAHTTFTTSWVCGPRHGRSPSPASPLSPPCAASASPAGRTLPGFRAFQHDTDHPRCTQHMGQLLPIARIALNTSPRAATVSSASAPSARSQLLSGTPSTTWSTAGVRS